VRKRRHVGRATVPRSVGRARVGRARGQAPTPERAYTEVMKLDSEGTPPVFVDPSGARRRRVRVIAYAIGLAALLSLLALWLSQLAGAVRPAPAEPCASAAASADREACR
jgi:hypothetical protein